MLINLTLFAQIGQAVNPEIPVPKDYLKLEPVSLNVGDFAKLERTFTEDDTKNFANAIKDEHAIHLNPDNIKTFAEKDSTYGMFSSSMFTSIIRKYFPTAVYLKQQLKFKLPVFLNEKVKATMVVRDIHDEKKIVTFDTIISKINGSSTEKVAIEGEAQIIIPTLKVR